MTGKEGVEPFFRALAQAAREWGVPLDGGAVWAMARHLWEVDTAGRGLNLTAIRGPERMAVLHALDSLAPLKLGIAPVARAVDVGSGAGFPGIPLLLGGWCQNLRLVEATRKKTAFLRESSAGRRPEVEVLWSRAEAAAARAPDREAAVVRALAPLWVVLELAMPLVVPGGVVWAWKGPEVEGGELEVARRTAQALGAEPVGMWRYRLPRGAGDRRLIGYRRVGALPPGVPRAAAVARRRPLGGA